MQYALGMIAGFAASVWLALVLLTLRDRFYAKTPVEITGWLPEPRTVLGRLLVAPLRFLWLAVLLVLIGSILFVAYATLIAQAVRASLTGRPSVVPGPLLPEDDA
jgi:hypothetical protein